jgi:transposase InsO family protein
LWVADITYIRLQTEFVYLAVILDAFSRRVIGWALDRTVENELCLVRTADGVGAATAGARSGAPFRSRQPIRVRRLHRSAEGTRLSNQHKSQVESLGNPRCNH